MALTYPIDSESIWPVLLRLIRPFPGSTRFRPLERAHNDSNISGRLFGMPKLVVKIDRNIG